MSLLICDIENEENDDASDNCNTPLHAARPDRIRLEADVWGRGVVESALISGQLPRPGFG
jgi:hypothetical protein